MTTQQDPHKHPLYRPHHGDMTGWRYLGPQEKVQDHDEFIMIEDDDEGWFATLHGGEGKTSEELCGPHSAVYRRRVTAESKPGEQKRFVTVICAPQDDLAQIRIGEVYNGLLILQIREGNALALLDGIEERVVKAIRVGV